MLAPLSTPDGGAADCETLMENIVYDWESGRGAAPVPHSQSYMTSAAINGHGAPDGGCPRLREDTGSSARASCRSYIVWRHFFKAISKFSFLAFGWKMLKTV